MMFQLRVHKTTLLNLAPVKHFEKSENQLDGRDTAFDISWNCPRCKHTNNYKQCVLRPDHHHFIRVFCRGCLSRWDIENKAFGLPALSAPLESCQQVVTSPALAGKRINSSYRMEILKAGRDLQEDPFDPDRHVRFANALRDVKAFGAARLHYQQAIDICEYRDQSDESDKNYPSHKYFKMLNELISDSDYLKYSEIYFVSISNILLQNDKKI